MTALPPLWAFFGLFAGPWKLAIVAAAVAMLYGRAIRPHLGRFITLREASSRKVATPAPTRPIIQGRLYFLLVVMAATAVATWIILRMTISVAAHSPR